jgi:hypothetical protein
VRVCGERKGEGGWGGAIRGMIGGSSYSCDAKRAARCQLDAAHDDNDD